MQQCWWVTWDGRFLVGGWHNRTCEIKSSVSAIPCFIFSCCLWMLIVAMVTGGEMVGLVLCEMARWCSGGSGDGPMVWDGACTLTSGDQNDDPNVVWTWPNTLLYFLHYENSLSLPPPFKNESNRLGERTCYTSGGIGGNSSGLGPEQYSHVGWDSLNCPMPYASTMKLPNFNLF